MKGRYRFENLSKELPSIIALDNAAGLLRRVISAKRLANLDSIGQGPGWIRIGRKVAYRTDDFLEWLESRTVELV